jgi:hypothetical protein
MRRYPYPIGAVVKYGASTGVNVEVGTVTALLGPFTVVIDKKIVVPISLIRGLVQPSQES